MNSRNVQFALRRLRQHPAFTLTIVLTLAFGIGINITMFSAVRTVLIRPLDFPHSSELATLELNGERETSWPDFDDLRLQAQQIQLAAYLRFTARLRNEQEEERVSGLRVSDNFFNTLEVEPLLGRFFIPGEDKPGAARNAVISAALWRRRYQSDPQIIGRRVMIGGDSYSIVGVAAEQFDFPVSSRTAVWIPLDTSQSDFKMRHMHFLLVCGRVHEGVSFSSAERELEMLYTQVMKRGNPSKLHRAAELISLHDATVQPYRSQLLLLSGAAVLMLLISCANLANMMLAHNQSRTVETAIRSALGASRGHLLLQFITENLVLSLAGAVVALPCAYGAMHGLRLLGQGVPRLETMQIDMPALLFTFVLATATVLFFGIGPAYLLAMTEPRRVNTQSGVRSSMRFSQAGRGSMIVVETTVAFILLVNATLVLSSLWRLQHRELGVDISEVHALRVSSPSLTGLESSFQPLLEEIHNIPGTSSAGITNLLPLKGEGMAATVSLNHRQLNDAPELRMTTPGFYEALKVPILQGRGFSSADNAGSAPIAIVNDEFVKRFVQDGNALGKIIEFPGFPRSPSYEIIGVSRGIRQYGPEEEVEPEIDLALFQANDATPFSGYISRGDLAVVIRSSSSGPVIAARLKAANRWPAIAPATVEVQELNGLLGDHLQKHRAAVIVFGLLAALSIVLVCIGLYGVVTYIVGRRFKEIGIRVALGAQRGKVMILCQRQTVLLVLLGIALGSLGSAATAKLLRSLLFGIKGTDLSVYFFASLLFLAVALIATAIPATRAARISPCEALRTE